MRIAIATDGNEVSAHFGRCQSYTVVDIRDGKLVQKKLYMNPGHEPGAIPEFLHAKGAQRIVCGGIGNRARELFGQYDIEVLAGINAPVDKVIEEIAAGTLTAGESLCIPGEGRGTGVEKTECDHEHSRV